MADDPMQGFYSRPPKKRASKPLSDAQKGLIVLAVLLTVGLGTCAYIVIQAERNAGTTGDPAKDAELLFEYCEGNPTAAACKDL